MKTYLFYDIETTGLNKAFDQVLQFAAIRTDLKLNELEHHEFFVRLNMDVIPSPYATITHGISIEKSRQGITEFEAITKIHRLLNTPGTISVGYNTLGFDDEFLRFSFYRNLLTPYTHQYANNCGRMDIYPIALLYYLYQNNVIKWPDNSMKLEALNAANHFAHGTAHDAMTDAQITLALARCFIKKHDVWEYSCGYFNKTNDLERMTKLPLAIFRNNVQHQKALLLDGIFGPEQSYQCPVLSLGIHHHYKNQTLWLRLDLPKLANTTEDDVTKTTEVIHKKAGELGILLPTHKRFLTCVDEDRLRLMENNKEFLKRNPGILKTITHYYQEYTYPKIPDIDIDAALYQRGFLTPHEVTLCRVFHEENTDGKVKLLEKMTSELQEQAIRILGRLDENLLPNQYAVPFKSYLQRINTNTVILDYRGEKRLIPQTALNDIKQLRETSQLTKQQLTLLVELEAYLNVNMNDRDTERES